MVMSFLNFSILNILILNSHLKKQKDDKSTFSDVIISKTDQNFCSNIYLKIKNMYPSYLINKQVKRFNKLPTNNCNRVKVRNK